MSMTGLEVFDDTVHKTNAWLNDIMEVLHWNDRQRAYLALRATLHAVRDRIIPEEAVHLGAQLPMLIRGFYYESWNPGGRYFHERTEEEFLRHVMRSFNANIDVDPRWMVTGVFSVINRWIDPGQIEQVRDMLPEDVRALWPLPYHELV